MEKKRDRWTFLREKNGLEIDRERNSCNFRTLYSAQSEVNTLTTYVHSRVIRPLWMTQVSSCGTAQCALIKGVLFYLMDLSKFQYLENECLECSHVAYFFIVNADFQAALQQTDWGSNLLAILSRIHWNYLFNFTLHYFYLTWFGMQVPHLPRSMRKLCINTR